MKLSTCEDQAQRWLERPLCRRFATVVFCRNVSRWTGAAPASSQAVWWALGTLNDGEAEVLGAWKEVDEKAALLSEVFGQLHERGVVSIRFCVGNIGSTETVFRETFRHAAVVPSIEDDLAAAVSMARPRHRPAVWSRLRATAELDCSEDARSEFAIFQASELGERYPGIVRQWDEALARFEAFYALDASSRELVRSADRTAADLRERLNRAIQRHGPFTDPATALDFVVAWLSKAERALDRGRTFARGAGVAGSGSHRSLALASGAAGVPMSA